GPSAARPDLEQSAAVDERDRAAAGTNCMDVKHWGLDRVAMDHRLPREPYLAPLQQRDISRGAAHIEGDDVFRAGKARYHLRADHTGARPRQPRTHWQTRRRLEIDHASIRLRQVRRRAHPERCQPLGDTANIGSHYWSEIRVDHGRRRPLIYSRNSGATSCET